MTLACQRPRTSAYMLAIVTLLAVAGCQQAPAKSPQGSVDDLRVAITKFYAGMSSTDGDMQERALRAILPVKADCELLFPQHAERVWQVYQATIDEMLERSAELRREVRKKGRELRIEPIDIRQIDPALYGDVLRMLPPDLPVYRVITHYENSKAASSCYVYTGNRWVWFSDLYAVPQLVNSSG